jgi:hypothetical protein
MLFLGAHLLREGKAPAEPLQPDHETTGLRLSRSLALHAGCVTLTGHSETPAARLTESDTPDPGS